MKVFLWGEDKAASPPKVQDAAEAFPRKFCQIVPGSNDIEGRQVRYIAGYIVAQTYDHDYFRVMGIWDFLGKYCATALLPYRNSSPVARIFDSFSPYVFLNQKRSTLGMYV